MSRQNKKNIPVSRVECHLSEELPPPSWPGIRRGDHTWGAPWDSTCCLRYASRTSCTTCTWPIPSRVGSTSRWGSSGFSSPRWFFFGDCWTNKRLSFWNQFSYSFHVVFEGLRERTEYIDIFLFFRPSLNHVLFPMFCLLVERECQILVF